MAQSPVWDQLVAAAATLHQDVLKRGLSDGHAGLVDVLPEFYTATALIPTLLGDTNKTLELLSSTTKAFRCARAEAARVAARKPGSSPKSPGNISKEASIAGSFFERQLAIAVLSVAVPDLLATAAGCIEMFRRVPDDVLEEVRIYATLPYGQEGIAALCATFESSAEAQAQAVKERIVAEKVAAGGGASEARIRNNAASRKSDAKKNALCMLTRQQVHHMLGLRKRIAEAMGVYSLELSAEFDTYDATQAS
jgi:hypothetical protein